MFSVNNFAGAGLMQWSLALQKTTLNKHHISEKTIYKLYAQIICETLSYGITERLVTISARPGR